jgi:hypothetical protein
MYSEWLKLSRSTICCRVQSVEESNSATCPRRTLMISPWTVRPKVASNRRSSARRDSLTCRSTAGFWLDRAWMNRGASETSGSSTATMSDDCRTTAGRCHLHLGQPQPHLRGRQLHGCADGPELLWCDRLGESQFHVRQNDAHGDRRAPPNGGVFDRGDVVPFTVTVTVTVTVTDPEDGTVDCSKVTIQAYLGHNVHGHPLDQYQGCSAQVQTTSASGHSEGDNTFYVIEASYTDKGGTGGANPLTGRGQVLLQPKHKQAEFSSATGGCQTAPAPAARAWWSKRPATLRAAATTSGPWRTATGGRSIP